MEHLFFVNAFFEEELFSSASSMHEYLCKHSVYLQLHYLSYLLAEESEEVLLLFPPEEGYLERIARLGIMPSSSLLLGSSLQKKYRISSWAPSLLLVDFSRQHNCVYNIPNWDVVKQVNGKDFSFSLAPKLLGGELLSSEEEIRRWYHSVKGPKVLKTLYGASGRGHCILYKENEEEVALQFFRREKARSCFFIAEPWFERVLDFSSQWYITEQGLISYIGSTLCENSPRGTYRKSFIGPVDLLFKEYLGFLEEHISYAKKALEQMRELGFFGPVGIDAMLYKHPQTKKIQLQPILEINARRTMGWAALKLYEKLKWDRVASFSYELKKTGRESFLPHYVLGEQKRQIPLPGQLVMDFL